MSAPQLLAIAGVGTTVGVFGMLVIRELLRKIDELKEKHGKEK